MRVRKGLEDQFYREEECSEIDTSGIESIELGGERGFLLRDLIHCPGYNDAFFLIGVYVPEIPRRWQIEKLYRD